jgi:hypothetical protein
VYIATSLSDFKFDNKIKTGIEKEKNKIKNNANNPLLNNSNFLR